MLDWLGERDKIPVRIAQHKVPRAPRSIFDTPFVVNVIANRFVHGVDVGAVAVLADTVPGSDDRARQRRAWLIFGPLMRGIMSTCESPAWSCPLRAS